MGRKGERRERSAGCESGSAQITELRSGGLVVLFDALEFYGFVSAASMIVRVRESVIPYQRWVTILLEV